MPCAAAGDIALLPRPRRTWPRRTWPRPPYRKWWPSFRLPLSFGRHCPSAHIRVLRPPTSGGRVGAGRLTVRVDGRQVAGGGVWMEASAPGQKRRGRRRAWASGSPLSRAPVVVLLLYALLVRAPGAGAASAWAAVGHPGRGSGRGRLCHVHRGAPVPAGAAGRNPHALGPPDGDAGACAQEGPAWFRWRRLGPTGRARRAAGPRAWPVAVRRPGAPPDGLSREHGRDPEFPRCATAICVPCSRHPGPERV